MAAAKGKITLIPLGGLGEIGKNMMVVKYEDNILVIDAGLMFPEDDMPGIDFVIPDITYLLENKEMVRGIVLTHGHEDHIGALPYVLKQLNVPVYGTRLTLGLLQGKLREAGILGQCKLVAVKPRDSVTIGPFKVEFIRVSHSIPDAVAIAVRTPLGVIVHTGDFKFDQTPVDGEVTDFHKFAELGDQGVLVLLADSTNAERPGYTMSERTVGLTFDETFQNAKNRIIVATFASNVHRLQQVINAAHKYGRKVAVSGRSMVNVVNIATELGYLTYPEDIMIDLDDINDYPANEVVILTTGSQGEPMSALTRMANADHRQVEILPGDTVIISATPIPGNERMVSRVINSLFKQGAEVIYEKFSGIHVSGHPSQEELKLMLNLVRPKFFVPVHGEYRHLIKHAQLAKEMGMDEANIFVAENGQVLEFTRKSGRVAGRTTAGKVLVDGLGVGDVGNIVLRDRKQLAQDGILIVVVTMNKETGAIVAGPDIVSRGFVYVREAEKLMEEAKEKVKIAIEKTQVRGNADWASIKAGIRDSIGKYLYEKTRRRPMILPIIMEV
ncbi:MULTISPECIES: ribonuclease J [Carboxydocella]|uniref:Ribonuclease J n=2 Tax=Carboxydocella TaxID=178898 RepID=A0A1T4P5K6_9FIRM|nr:MULTISPECIES: ribonuclease J [Carboxydocella]AVX20701.1 ribonuclease J [Carboxydocella thermautotrophica]AVX31120.1 ribonuclease J [Carboxydocella thermautotrophica]SJZ86691.1 ribonuclease J [Carboxydocella sporoproducens DSM 16521]GAW28230.1 ribonuclease J [Carboxydocella sp. ULO1]GAW32838.1 ribonuclease J [Carboxydocella sp. JDF658]